MSTYRGDYPVPEWWLTEHLDDDKVSLIYPMDLVDIINVDHIEGMNDYLDDYVTTAVTAVLTNITYEAVGYSSGGAVLIKATGVLEATT